MTHVFQTTVPSTLARGVFILLMLGGAAFITLGSIEYFVGEYDHPFIVEKLPLPLESLWLAALKVHVVCALLALPACLLLLSRWFIKRAPRAHRVIGRVIGGAILFGLVPSGAYLALFAKGGVPVTIGFVLSAVIVAYAMTRAIFEARKKAYTAHRRYIAHVVAQLSVAVTSRLMLVVLDAAAVDPELAYVAALWVPVIGSALIAELISPMNALTRRHRHASAPERSRHEAAAVFPVVLDPAR